MFEVKILQRPNTQQTFSFCTAMANIWRRYIEKYFVNMPMDRTLMFVSIYPYQVLHI